MSKVFFGNSGAEANEGAIKAARKYSFDKYGADRYNVITLVNSFHGRTIATLTATGQGVFHNYFGPFNEGFQYVKAGDIDALTEMVDRHTCAVMLELVQGEGGVVALEPEYVQAVRALCDEKTSSSSWTRCRPAWAAPAPSCAASTTTSSPTSSRWPRVWAAVCRSALS